MPDMEMLVCPLEVLQSSGIHLITLVSLSSLKSQHGRQCYIDGKDKFRMVGLLVFFDKPALQNSCKHIWKPELSKTTTITNSIYSTCFNKCPEKKGFKSMCFNQRVSVDRNLHGYGSEPFSPSDSPEHEQTSLTILSLVLIH